MFEFFRQIAKVKYVVIFAKNKPVKTLLNLH